MTGILIRKWPCEDKERQEEHHVKTEAEVRVTPRKAKDCWPSPEAGKGVGSSEKEPTLLTS